MKGKAALWLACALGILIAAAALSGGGGDSASQMEKRMAEVLSAIAGAGKVEVALFYQQREADAFGAQQVQTAPTGAIIVAEGAGEMRVRLQLIRAARALMGLPEAAVDVFVMEENRR